MDNREFDNNNQDNGQSQYEEPSYDRSSYDQSSYDRPSYDQSPFGQPPYEQYPNQQVNKPRNGLGITSMILGIISVVFSCCCYGLSVVLGIVAIILGIVSMRKNETTKGFAIAGIITGSIGLVFAVLFIVLEIYVRQSGLYDYYMEQILGDISADENIRNWIN